MLKRVVFVAALLLVGGNVMMAQRAESAQQSEQVDKKAQKAAKKAEKEARKAAEEAEAAAAHALAVKALEAQDFVLEASKIEFKRGQFEYVQANSNFVMLKGDKATVQLAMNGRFAGPNGMGGFTVDGKASNIEMKTDKKGNITYEFHVMGTGISARVFFRMAEGTNQCRATVYPNFSSNVLTFDGIVVPTRQSNIFKGRSL